MSNRPGTLRVLHVDDDEAFAELAAASLVGGRVALYVETEPDPRQALARIGDGERFDCVVTDQDVSGLDGLSLAESVREKRPDLPVVLFSGTVLCVSIGEHGVLTIGDLDGDGLDDATIQLVGILAANAETALDRIDRQRELERQNERLDEFAGVVSHDLRNPLNVALAWIDMLEEDGDGVDLAQVRTPLERMETLIEDILSLSRGGRDVIDPEPIPLAGVVEQGWATAGSLAGQLVVDGDLGTIEGDGGRLQQLFENLFRNAREHVGEGVTVRVGPTDSGFYVEDDGPGFPATERDRAFESGYTTTERGTGFGLAIVERIVEAHGWSIEIVDGRDGGARFEITGVEAA